MISSLARTNCSAWISAYPRFLLFYKFFFLRVFFSNVSHLETTFSDDNANLNLSNQNIDFLQSHVQQKITKSSNCTINNKLISNLKKRYMLVMKNKTIN